MSSHIAQAAKHTGINALLYALICVFLVAAYVAYDTNWFTKQPSWWHARQAIGYDTPAN